VDGIVLDVLVVEITQPLKKLLKHLVWNLDEDAKSVNSRT
jgi:hypothetical protein